MRPRRPRCASAPARPLLIAVIAFVLAVAACSGSEEAGAPEPPEDTTTTTRVTTTSSSTTVASSAEPDVEVDDELAAEIDAADTAAEVEIDGRPLSVVATSAGLLLAIDDVFPDGVDDERRLALVRLHLSLDDGEVVVAYDYGVTGARLLTPVFLEFDGHDAPVTGDGGPAVVTRGGEPYLLLAPDVLGGFLETAEVSSGVVTAVALTAQIGTADGGITEPETVSLGVGRDGPIAAFIGQVPRLELASG